MSDTKYQGGPYQPNPTSYPPLVTAQGPPVMAVTVPQPEPTYEHFDKKKAKICSILLIILGCVTAIVTLVCLSVLGILAIPVPIVAGVFGIFSAKQPSNIKIVCFMVLSIISAVIAAIMILVCITLVAGTSYADTDNDLITGFFIGGIIGIFLYAALTAVSIYSSILCRKEVNCCQSRTTAQTQGVVHGQVHQPGGPGVQYMQPGGQHNQPAHPPPYTQAVQQA